MFASNLSTLCSSPYLKETALTFTVNYCLTCGKYLHLFLEYTICLKKYLQRYCPKENQNTRKLLSQKSNNYCNQKKYISQMNTDTNLQSTINTLNMICLDE